MEMLSFLVAEIGMTYAGRCSTVVVLAKACARMPCHRCPSKSWYLRNGKEYATASSLIEIILVVVGRIDDRRLSWRAPSAFFDASSLKMVSAL